MLARTRERLANEAATWRHLGLIDDTLAGVLAARYDSTGAGTAILLRWLGFFGAYMLGMSLLGMVGLLAATWSLLMPAFLLGATAAGLWMYGGRLANDPTGRYPVLGAALITVGLMSLYAALAALYLAVGGGDEYLAFSFILVLTAVAALATGYRFRLRWPLLFGLLLLFQGIGSGHGYLGSGGYYFDLHDPRLALIVAVAIAAFGVWHESVAEQRLLRHHTGFGSLYIIFGLLYANSALWLMSLWPGGLGWVLVFTAAAIGQIVIGSLLKDSRFTGFGIVFLSLSLYTRFFEHFWDHLSIGLFFLIGGLSAVLLGAVFEGLAKRSRT